jgi:hypothetical protein
MGLIAQRQTGAPTIILVIATIGIAVLVSTGGLDLAALLVSPNEFLILRFLALGWLAVGIWGDLAKIRNWRRAPMPS